MIERWENPFPRTGSALARYGHYDIDAIPSARLRLESGLPLSRISAGPLQALADGLLEHGLVADPGLFGDPLRLFEIGDRDAN